MHKRGIGAKKTAEQAGSHLKNIVGALGKAVVKASVIKTRTHARTHARAHARTRTGIL